MPWPQFMTRITKDSFFLIHKCPQDFLLSKWCDNPLIYAVWSSVCSIYTMSMVLYTGFVSQYGIKIMIWLTYWSFYALALRFTVTAGNCWFFIWSENNRRRYSTNNDTPETVSRKNNCHIVAESNSTENIQITSCDDRKDEQSEEFIVNTDGHNLPGPEGLPVNVTCQWLLQNISNAVTILVTILYWLLVYTGEPQDYASINSHVITSILVTADIMISRAPIRLQHFHIPLVYLSIYICFTLVYWAAGGTNHKEQHFIYSTLDYSKRPKSAALTICLIALIGMLVFQSYVYFLYRLRNAMYNCKRTGSFSLREQ